MLETSQDLLYVVLSFCVLWFTIFICWAIYYFAMILREGNKIIKDFRETLEVIDDFFATVKSKFESSVNYLTLLGETMKQGLGYLKEYKEKKAKKRGPI